MISAIIFVVSTQISLLYIPDTTDLAQESMKNLFGINLRTSIASLTMYFLSNILGIWIFEKLKQKFHNKLWLRYILQAKHKNGKSHRGILLYGFFCAG